MKESVFSYECQLSLFKLLVYSNTFFFRDLDFRFINMHKGVLIKMQGYTRSYELAF